MPENLDSYGADETQENRFVEVDWDEIGDKLKHKFNEGNGKPIFTKNTNAVIDSIELKRQEKARTDRKGKEYYDTLVTIKTVYEDGQESYDNYGGLREYNEEYWVGEKSAFGRLKKLVSDEFGIDNWNDMLVALKDAKVKVKTEETSFQGRTYSKNIIQSFR